MLAHILGRLPCPKKTPRKIWNSVLAHYQNRMKIRKAKIIAECSAALRKFAKSGTNLQIASLFVHIITAKLLQKHQLPYVTRIDQLRKTTTRCETVREKLRFGRTTSRGIAPNQMAWPSQRANGSVVPRDMERA